MILVLGSKGMLGHELIRGWGKEAMGWAREDFDFAKILDYKKQIGELNPTVIVNCVAYNNVDKAEEDQELSYQINGQSVGELAKICKELDIILVHFSTNYVFDGEKGGYQEDDLPNPLSVYAKSKYEGEKLVQKFCEKFYIVRTAVLFGEKGTSTQTKSSFVELVLDKISKHQDMKAVKDEFNNPTYALDLAKALKLLLTSNKPFGVYHITNSGGATWYDYAKEIVEIKQADINITPVVRQEFPRLALTPKKATLVNTKLPLLRSWQEALKDFLANGIF